jgi:hypothetical protein
MRPALAFSLFALWLLPPPAAATELPQAIAAPGEVLVASAFAVGAQVYECKYDIADNLIWQLREPIATLFIGGKTVGRHYAGPTWELSDGSVVSGKVAGRAAAAKATDIPLLKLDASTQRSGGQLAEVTTIQRLNTRGGVAEGICELPGTVVSVPYTAEYAFYRRPDRDSQSFDAAFAVTPTGQN